ncbi:MAG: hypothetical protein CUN49_05450 [Candidatus Thermofonsia Clade 1 bacterium]|jgi:hypothetical protein|uniref:DUF4397 domain-containing protein n=1 Tax=Candidatus Thermofonsia Clade 1 bacterium TaxID=2364210 RepID=A0A2M8Q0V5_9CHLR|nr:MAG: hypothetical protein CUN49_05450 [Candidatus Thermofonsia Clade 1 bacterium]PJF43431.1 MAG: hypothetical protein CUN50_00470 [Candidatus Thermofonsia Clade 1 bacterium]RMF49345.1 MAG: hypothetical protein D6749_13415 [Chloroflexota bacterium]
MLKRLAALSLLAALVFHALPALRAQEAEPIAYGESASGSFANGGQALFTFDGKAGDVIYIFPQGTDLFSTLEFDIRLSNSRNAAVGKLYNKDRLQPVLLAELPADDRYTITLIGKGSGDYLLSLEKTLNLLPDSLAEGKISSNESHFYLIRGSQPLKISLTYTRLSGTFSPELRIEEFTQGIPREVAAISGRALRVATLALSLEANVEYLVTLAQKPFDFASILERTTPLSYQISVKSDR